MRVLIPVAVVLLAFLLFATDRAVKAIERGRRRREANRRLAAAAAQAEAQHRQRKAAEQVSGALTSVMPTIHDVDARLVGQPAVTGSAGPRSPAITGSAGPRSPAITGSAGPRSPAMTGPADRQSADRDQS